MSTKETNFFSVNKKSSINCYTGEELRQYCQSAYKLKRRYCTAELEVYLRGTSRECVGVLYGLRRTGKTTIMQQFAYEHAFESAYIICQASTTLLSDVIAMINEFKFKQHNIRYIFIDEITFCSDFVDSVNLLPPLADETLRIVCAGTDSFGFLLARHYLYDRTYMIHTTYISFKEFSYLTGRTIDDYIRYGGTFTKGFAATAVSDIDNPFIFSENRRKCIDTSIVSNLLNPIRNIVKYDDLAQYEPLAQTYELNMLKDLITLAVNRAGFSFAAKQLCSRIAAKDMAHAGRVLSQRLANWKQDVYSPGETRLSGEQLAEMEVAVATLNNSDFAQVFWSSVGVKKAKLMGSVEYIQDTLNLLQGYFHELDILYDLVEYTFISVNNSVIARQTTTTAFSQPGLLYGYTKQLLSLVQSVIEENTVCTVVSDKIDTISLGEILEVIVAADVQRTLNKSRYLVAKCKFNLQQTGEYDLVVCDTLKHCSTIIEIKHSDRCVPEQAKHLLNPSFQAVFEQKLPPIRKRLVLYLGETVTDNSSEVNYVNVAEFLRNIHGYIAQ